MAEVTRLLSEIEKGTPKASDELLPLVYEELRKLAASRLAHEKPDTLQATALVHEAYLRLVQVDEDVSWENRRHFFAAAAESMKRILVEEARRRKSLKRGGDRRRIELDDNLNLGQQDPEDILALSEALDALAAEDKTKADLVKLRYLAGLSHKDAARALGISRPTADRYWAYAKARLFLAMTGGAVDDE